MSRELSLNSFSKEMGTEFNHKKFIQQFKLAKKKGKPKYIRQLRILVQKQTINAVQNNRYIYGKEKLQLYDDLEKRAKQAKQARIYTLKNLLKTDLSKYKRYENPCVVEVVNEDCMVAAIDLKYNKNLNPLLLNMANKDSMGGGFRQGCGAQEENLMRRTTMYVSFYNPFREASKRNWRYPLPMSGGCYTPNVIVFRGPESEGYRVLPEKFEISLVAVAAVKGPNTKRIIKKKFKDIPEILGQTQYVIGEERRMLKKIETIFRIALARNHDSMVLSALGCGAFRHPPFHCAVLFKKMVQKYRHFFKRITFAIIEDHNSKHNKFGNFRPFESVMATIGNKTEEPEEAEGEEEET